MDISDFDLSVIYTRPDGSYVIDGGMYHVPDDGEYEALWEQVNSYAGEHPDAVQPEPERQQENADEEPSLDERLSDIEDALVELAGIIAGGE